MQTPSVIRAEFTREREELDKFRQAMNSRIRDEDAKQKLKLDKLKAKYDRAGVENVSSESEIGRKEKPLSASNLGPQPGEVPPVFTLP